MIFRRKPKPAVQPEWLVVGLGNPGQGYRGTRHNVGFEVIDSLASRNGIKLDRGRHRALTGSGSISGVPVLLVKPLTFMNLSGQSVAPLMRSANLKPERVLVIADDLDLPVGKVKMRLKGSAGGHNGHKSLIAALHSQEYPRIKIGIGKVSRLETIDHVLSRFDEDERDLIDAAIELAVESAERVVSQNVEAGLNYLASHQSPTA